jgi:hypothetical protein
MSPDETFNPVTRPKHYVAKNGLEAIDCIQAFAGQNYLRGTALKYLLRAGNKDDLKQDLEKAVWYIQREIAGLKASRRPGFDVIADHQDERPKTTAFSPCSDCRSPSSCEFEGACLGHRPPHL